MTPEDQLRAFGYSLTREQRRILRQVHNAMGFMCSACNEGLECCVHIILNDGFQAGEYACAGCGEFVIFDDVRCLWHNGTSYVCADGAPHKPPDWVLTNGQP